MPALTFTPQLVPGVPTASADCGPASGAALVAFATNGTHRPSAADVRALVRTPQGRPDYGPTNVGQIAAAIRRGWNVAMDIESPDTFELFAARLADDSVAATVYVNYGVLRGTPYYASLSGFSGSHSVPCWDVARGTVLVADPLADGRAALPRAPERWDLSLLRRAAGYVRVKDPITGAWRNLGVGRIIVGYVRAPEVPDPPKVGEPMLNLVPMTLRRLVHVPKGTRLLREPDGVLYSTVSRDVELGLMGAPDGEHYIVASGDAGVYVKRADVGKPYVGDKNVGA